MSIINIYIKNIRKQKIGFLLLLISSLFVAIQQCLTPWLIKCILNTLASKNFSEAELYKILFIFISIYFISEIIIRSQGILIAKVIPVFKENIKSFLVKKTLKNDCQYFLDNSPGKLIQKIQDFTNSSERVLQIAIYNFFTIIISFLLTSILLFFITPLYTFLILTWFATHIFSTYLRFQQSTQYIEDHHSIHSNISGNLSELLSKIMTVKIFNSEGFELERMNNYFSQEKKSLQKAQIFFEKIKVFQSLLSIFLIVILISHQLYGLMHGKFQAGDFIFVIFITYNLINYVWFSSFQLTIFIREFGIVKSSFKVLFNGDPDFYFSNIRKNYELISNSPTFKVQNLSFSLNENEKIIDNLSLEISFGEKILLKGNSGTGKSTLAKLLTRLHTNFSGNISIDGVNIKKIPSKEFKKLVILVEQNILLFNRTIRENICYNTSDYTEAQLLRVLNLACCDDFINKLPNGLDTKIGEGGILLSGGQTQRIAIARALLAQPKLLILDESTSGLEKWLEKRLINNLLSIPKQTLLIISHSTEIKTLITRHVSMSQESAPHHDLNIEVIC